MRLLNILYPWARDASGRDSILIRGKVQKRSSSKASALLTRGAYAEYVSTTKWRERSWRLFSTFPLWQTFIVMFLLLPPTSTIANEETITTSPAPKPFTDLNLRFSNRPLIPPHDLIVQTIPLIDVSVASSFVAPSPQAVIFEDEQRRRLAILSTNETEPITLFLLEPLPLDPKVPSLVQCANAHRCQSDRTPLTGGLGCLALCIKEHLETISENPLPR